MALFKCKMCGGTLEISENQTVAECEYCGTQQTLPKLDDERKANLYDRANHFRRNNEFDKAMSIYENILSEDSTDAEAYWSLVLCRYGIEYVEDPATQKRVPTVNRAQFTSIFDDDNYKSALSNADALQRTIYEAEAKAINEIQKGILAISQKEEPFDVFICYKETDNNGRRTPDSVLANDLYHQLVQEGFKVFFSRITLEDKLGTAYEPYIFAALNSAKVMVVLGTRPEYFKAVWVKNEWSRYLALVKQSGGKKVLIPAYKDMDPYDLPEEFSHLQAQDMGKLGFMQDLIRGIKKLTQVDAPVAVKETVVVNNSNANVAPLLRRAFMYLEDGEWQTADEYCEKVLDQEPENAEAYLGKLMAELRVRKQGRLQDQGKPFDGNNNYQKALRFGDNELKAELTGCIDYINTRNETARLEGVYCRAQNAISIVHTESAYKEAAQLFESISEYKDSGERAKEYWEKAEIARKDAIYDNAQRAAARNTVSSLNEAAEIFKTIPGWKDADEQVNQCLEKAEAGRKDDILIQAKAIASARTIPKYEAAITMLKTIPGWKDADEQVNIYREKIEEIKAKDEADRLKRKQQMEIDRLAAEKQEKRKRIIAIIAAAVVCGVIAFVIVRNFVIIPNGKYNDAVVLMEAGKYEEAISAFEALGTYKDSPYRILETRYLWGKAYLEKGNYSSSISLLSELGDYKDTQTLILEAKYQQAQYYMEKDKYSESISLLSELGDYKDAQTLILEARYQKAQYCLEKKNYSLSISLLSELGDYKDTQTLILEGKYQYAKYYLELNNYAEAKNYFKQAAGYKDADELFASVDEVRYNNALQHYQNERYTQAATEFAGLGSFKDSSTYLMKCYETGTMRMVDQSNLEQAVALLRQAQTNSIKISLSSSDQKKYYDLVVASIPTDLGMQATSEKIREAATRLSYLPNSTTDIQNIQKLAELFEEISANSTYRDAFTDRLDQFRAIWKTDAVQKVMQADMCVAFFLMGEWKYTKDSSYYLKFYTKETNSNRVSASYNLPRPDVSAAYYDLKDMELVFLDEDSQVIAKVYKFEMTSADTMKLYCYEDGKTYTMKRS